MKRKDRTKPKKHADVGEGCGYLPGTLKLVVALVLEQVRFAKSVAFNLALNIRISLRFAELKLSIL